MSALRWARTAVLVLCLTAPASAWDARGDVLGPAVVAAPDSTFARLVERLSEPAGDFDSDNLISNEASYLHVVGKLRQMGVAGGAYLGVGPDQNFSYIAQIRPRVAFIIDIRRDNLLQHLLFKALFAHARNRAEYLALLFGRPAPRDVRRWNGRSVEELVRYIDSTTVHPELVASARARVRAAVQRYGLALSESDLATIDRIHASFIEFGMDLRFSSRGRMPRPYYPTFRQLLLETDLDGRQASFLASEDAFQFVKSLQARHLVVPVVGNLAGDHALAEIGRVIAERGERVSAFYTSNVEFYLMREGTFDQYLENVKRLPRDERSVVIRSFFGGTFGTPHPQAVPGYYSTQLLQTLETLVQEQANGGYRTYLDLVTKHSLDLR
jgi:hypothetical protein